MSKRTDQLTALTDTQVNDDTKIWPVAVALTGLMSKATTSQLKKVFGTFKKKYIATGSEGSVLVIAEIAAKEILAIYREGGILYEVTATPDSVEFVFDNTNVTLGNPTSAGERFLILYKNTIAP